jgi:hypothetical protein
MEVDDPRGNKKLPKVPLHGSWLGEVFAIGYIFNVFVKFKSLTDLGEGDKISLPVRIFNTPKLIQSTEAYRVPNQWNPVTD